MSASSPGSERIEWLDVLRGIAIAGMLLVHIGRKAHGSGVAFDHWAAGFDFFVTGKFYTIFALLFGIGFGLSPVIGFGRRLAGLALIMGTVKALLASSLLYYAIWGAPLIVLRRLSSRWLCAVAVALLFLQSLMPAADSPPHNIVEAFASWADPGYRGPFVLAMFLIGLMAVRHGLVRDPATHRPLFAGVAVAGILLAAWAWTLNQWGPPAALHGFGLIRTEWLGVSYAAGVVLLFSGPRSRRFVDGFRPLVLVGRASLSNYALHLVVLNSLRSLGVSVDWRLTVPVAALLFGVLAALSAWWFRFYKQGPLEWIWRSMSEGNLIPLRRELVPAASAASGRT